MWESGGNREGMKGGDRFVVGREMKFRRDASPWLATSTHRKRKTPIVIFKHPPKKAS